MVSLSRVRSVVLHWIRWPNFAKNRARRPAPSRSVSASSMHARTKSTPLIEFQSPLGPQTVEEGTCATERRSRSISLPAIRQDASNLGSAPSPPSEPASALQDGGIMQPEFLVTLPAAVRLGASNDGTTLQQLLPPQLTPPISNQTPSLLSPLDISARPPHLPQIPMTPDQVAEDLRAIRHYVRLVEKSLLIRTQLQNEQHNFQQLNRFVSESLGRLVALLQPRQDGSLDPSTLDELAAARSQYDSDIRALEASNASRAALQTNLSSLDFRMMNMQQDLTQAYQTLRGQLSTAAYPDDSDQSIASAQCKSDTPSLLQRYYDRKGDEGIYRERLMELEEYHHDGLITREMLRDRGEPLDTSDEDFLAQFEEQRRGIMLELEAAEADAEKLERQCEEAGLSTAVARSPSVVAPSLAAISYDYELVPQPMAGQDLLGEGYHDASLPALISSVQVAGWLDNIPAAIPAQVLLEPPAVVEEGELSKP